MYLTVKTENYNRIVIVPVKIRVNDVLLVYFFGEFIRTKDTVKTYSSLYPNSERIIVLFTVKSTFN